MKKPSKDSGSQIWCNYYIEQVEYLEKRNAELKDFCIWMTGCGYEFTKHDYFIKKRDMLLKKGE